MIYCQTDPKFGYCYFGEFDFEVLCQYTPNQDVCHFIESVLFQLLSPKAMLKTDTPRLSLSAGFTWDNTFSLPPPEVSKEDSDSDSEEEEGTDKKKV